MSKYEITIFDGDVNAGDGIIEASDMRDAITKGTEWAKGGDWDHPGTVELRIVGLTETERVSIAVGEDA